MILELFTLASLALAILSGWFDFEISLLIVLLPISIAYLIRILAIAYARISQTRWEEYQQMRAIEGEGMQEFREVMIGVFLGLLTRKKAERSEPQEQPITKETDYMPPGYEDDQL